VEVEVEEFPLQISDLVVVVVAVVAVALDLALGTVGSVFQRVSNEQRGSQFAALAYVGLL
jgi:hypothetical protein